jgi:hypothetical protein
MSNIIIFFSLGKYCNSTWLKHRDTQKNEGRNRIKDRNKTQEGFPGDTVLINLESIVSFIL